MPGLFGYEAGQSGVGDIFAWFVEHAVPARLRDEARGARASTSTRCCRSKAARLRPGESGLLALDWWNGNRSVLVDAELSGLLIGATLATTPEEIYRALIEATAFGTRVIVETFESNGVADRRGRRLRRAGRARARCIMQIYADVTGLPFQRQRVGPDAGPRLGNVRGGRGRRAAGGYATIGEAAAGDGPAQATRSTRRTPAHRERTTCCIASTCGCTTTSDAARTT